MGVCGYTYDQVNDMPMHALATGIAARNQMINGMITSVLKLFGAETAPEPKPKSLRKMTTALFDALFK